MYSFRALVWTGLEHLPSKACFSFLTGALGPSSTRLSQSKAEGMQNLMLDQGGGSLTVRSCILTPQPRCDILIEYSAVVNCPSG